jgi:hypothetical protein
MIVFAFACTPYNTNLNRAQVYQYPKNYNFTSSTQVWGVTIQTFNVRSGWIDIKGKKGTRLTLSTDCLIHADGTIADSIITICLKECYDNEDYILERAYTRTATDLLISAGSIFVEIKDSRGVLSVACEEGIEIHMPGNVDIAMQYFSGRTDEQGNLFWELSDSMESLNTSYIHDEVDWMEGDNEEGYYTAEQVAYNDYVFRTKSLGWINCDKFWEMEEEKRPIYVQLPAIPKNCKREVMLILIEQKSILPLYRKENLAYSDSIPLNLGAKVICIDYGKEEVYLGYQNLITGNEGKQIQMEKIPRNEFRRKLEEII